MTDFIISDLHVPFQDPKALNVVMKMIRHFRPNNVVMDGDMIDCSQLSRFSKAPIEPGSFRNDIIELADILREMQKYSNLVYIEGNHEARVQKYINDRAPELQNLISIEHLINSFLSEEIEYIRTTPGESMRTWGTDGRLLIGHFNKAAKNTCYSVKLLVEKYMANVVQAHTHRLGEYAIRGYDHTYRGWECGCLCDLNPEYVAKPNWQQGFLVYTEADDTFNMEIAHIEDGRSIFRGKVYKG